MNTRPPMHRVHFFGIGVLVLQLGRIGDEISGSLGIPSEVPEGVTPGPQAYPLHAAASLKRLSMRSTWTSRWQPAPVVGNDRNRSGSMSW